MATDSSGNLYVSCVCSRTDGSGDSLILGSLNMAPQPTETLRRSGLFTSPDMYPYTGGDGIAVDSAGTIYVSSGTTSGTPNRLRICKLRFGQCCRNEHRHHPGMDRQSPHRGSLCISSSCPRCQFFNQRSISVDGHRYHWRTMDRRAFNLRRALCRIILVALSCVLLVLHALGQAPSGSIYGTVSDSSGAVIPDVAVKATNEHISTSATTKTDASGKL
jgi:hypothetical protein